jgi:regulator of RNase E activity RraB
MTQQGGRPEGVPHTLTQEDMDNNPELASGGFKVGDEVIVPDEVPVEKQRSLKKEKK